MNRPDAVTATTSRRPAGCAVLGTTPSWRGAEHSTQRNAAPKSSARGVPRARPLAHVNHRCPYTTTRASRRRPCPAVRPFKPRDQPVDDAALLPLLAPTPLSVFETTLKSWSTYLAFLAFGFADATLCATVKRCLCFVGGTRAATPATQHVMRHRRGIVAASCQAPPIGTPRGCVDECNGNDLRRQRTSEPYAARN